MTMMGDISTLNPLIAEDASSGEIISRLLEGLTSWDPVVEKVIPGLAKSWDISEDNKTFTFHLREGVTWSDGHPFTSDDVVFTFQCYYDERFPNRSRFQFSIDGEPFKITKIDALTVEIVTPDIYAPFLRYMGGAEILPQHKLQAAFDDGTLLKQWTISTAQNNPDAIVSTGPFIMRSYKPGERLELERNPNYYRYDTEGARLPYIEHLIYSIVKDQNSSLIVFAQGESDLEGITPDDVIWVKRGEKAHGYTIHERGPSTSASFIWFNQNPGSDPNGKAYVTPHKLKWFESQKFRQAISYGINRQGIIDGVLAGRGTPLWGPVTPANAKWFNHNTATYPFNPEKALKLLESDGFTLNNAKQLHDRDGNRVGFTLFTNKGNDTRVEIATVFQQNMKSLGMDVKLQFIDFGTLVNKLSSSFDYECSLLGLTGGGDPAGGMDVYSSGGRMHLWYPEQKEPATPWEARLDLLMKQQLTTLDEQKRKAYYNEVQQIMSEQLPLIYLITPNAYTGMKNKWQNVSIPKIGSAIWNLEALWEK